MLTRFFNDEPDNRVTFWVIALAAFFTSVLLVFGWWILLRNQLPQGAEQVFINGNVIRVNYDPWQALVFVDGDPGVGAGQPVAPELQPTVLPTIGPTPIPPTATASTAMHIYTTHVVQAGDTLYSLSNQYNTTIELMARYGVSASDLVVGNSINIYYANPAYCPGYSTYILRKGDTLSSVALKCGTTVDTLVSINNPNVINTLDMTDVICVP